MYLIAHTCVILFCGVALVASLCDQKYLAMDSKHTACSTRSSNYLSGGVTDKVKQEILDLHNELRSKIAGTQKAANMQKMVWDDEIASVAQKMAENCVFAHDKSSQRGIPGKYGCGQNLAMGWRTWEDAIRAWFGEVKDFKYGHETVPFYKIGHFTQMTWAVSVRIGCGFADCKSIKNLYVCNYGPAGNIRPVSKPWIAGPKACSECPDTCRDNLCDCGGKVCFNGGKLDVNTCQCQCKDATYDPKDCTMDCGKVKDKFYCAFWGEKECKMYSNAPSDCPHLCKVCLA